jgi:hypothetical protein
METPHRGELLKAAIKRAGISHKAFALKLAISRGTLYNHYTDPDLPDTLMLESGRLLNHDFSEDIPALAIYRIPSAASSPAPRVPQTLPECQRELLSVYRKYVELLEDHMQLRRLTPA